MTAPEANAAVPSAAQADIACARAVRQAELVRDGELSAREPVALNMDRIARLDPELSAFRVVFCERALDEADVVQRRLAGGESLPLVGVPIAIKDDTDVAGASSMCGRGLFYLRGRQVR